MEYRGSTREGVVEGVEMSSLCCCSVSWQAAVGQLEAGCRAASGEGERSGRRGHYWYLG